MEEGVRALAKIPEGSELLYPPEDEEESASEATRKEAWPVLKVENIFVLPGIPQYFAEKVQIIAKHFIQKKQANDLHYDKSIVLCEEERTILSTLNRLVADHPSVKIGSYPYVDDPKVKTIITVRGTQSKASEVDAAVEDLCRNLSHDAVLRVEN